MSKIDTTCPSCGVDVQRQGFQLLSEIRDTWMLVDGNLTRVMGARQPVDQALCLSCGERLRVCAVDLLRDPVVFLGPSPDPPARG